MLGGGGEGGDGGLREWGRGRGKGIVLEREGEEGGRGARKRGGEVSWGVGTRRAGGCGVTRVGGDAGDCRD